MLFLSSNIYIYRFWEVWFLLWLRFSRSIYIGFASNYTHKYNLLNQQRRGDRIGTTAAAHILHFGVQNRLDLLDGHLQAHGHIVVAPLEQHLALKVDQFVFARANQQTDQFVVDVIVDLCGNVDKGFNKKKNGIHWRLCRARLHWIVRRME